MMVRKRIAELSDVCLINGIKIIPKIFVLIFLIHQETFAKEGGAARTFQWNIQELNIVQQKWYEGDPDISPIVNMTINYANTWKTRGPFSVMDKDEIPPSGDKHDFLSYGYYWWPNPDTEDGLPWILRDGYGNPDNAIDDETLNLLFQSLLNLSLAYYFTEDESYAEHAAYLLRVFFLDEDTLMYPRCLYAQTIPGINDGRCSVVNFAQTFRFILEAAGILERSPHWTEANKAGLQLWCLDFLAFFETEACAEQRDEPSNHGTSYDFLLTLLALYAEQDETARQKLMNYVGNRMPGQIDMDGSDPYEMLRIDNFLYHCANLQIMFQLAELSEHFNDIDLWNYQLEDGRGLRLALEFLIPYMTGDEEWDFWPGESFSLTPDRYFKLLRAAALGYDSFRYERLTGEIGYNNCNIDYYNIIYPRYAIITVTSDIDHDGDVDLDDFSSFSSAWKCCISSSSYNPACDISDPNDGIIDMLDLTQLFDQWLTYLQ